MLLIEKVDKAENTSHIQAQLEPWINDDPSHSMWGYRRWNAEPFGAKKNALGSARFRVNSAKENNKKPRQLPAGVLSRN